MTTATTENRLERCPTGIRGLDEVTGGGLPSDGITLICGGPGTGKTTLAMEFLARGADEHDERGLFVSFREREEDLLAGYASMQWGMRQLIESEAVQVEEAWSGMLPPAADDRGAPMDLDELHEQLDRRMESAEVRRVVLDGALRMLEPQTSRRGIHALFRWLESLDLTVLLTAEARTDRSGPGEVAEYLSDCVIALKRRPDDDLPARRLEVASYPDAAHGGHGYPFVITRRGVGVLPTGSSGFDYDVPDETISTGVENLDKMMERGGFPRGSSVLVTGSAGTGKTALGASMVDAACRRGEKCLFFSYGEPVGEIVRNMAGIGIELDQWMEQNRLRLKAARPAEKETGAHILDILRTAEDFEPRLVVIDPLPFRAGNGGQDGVETLLTHLVDRLKGSGITPVFTDLTEGDRPAEATHSRVGALMDVWINLRNRRRHRRRNLLLEIVKARGVGHSREERTVHIGEDGLEVASGSAGPSDGVGETGRRWMNAGHMQ